ncbi:uncharacterized protein LOC120839486 [Ixodes scapularis]|uniref:uncharacterized protein LOC120839486 n=1 Tax=Ixodes scapularis TaxID=6945 RepID=UPI001A9DF4A6|nr:uncharacterized protein LOC120839486 [Ixodes scapularis]
MCFVEPPPLQKAMPYNLVEDLNAEQNGYEFEMVNVVQETRATREVENMPVLSGRLNGQVVSVLRDTGSNTVITRRSLIPDSQLTGKMGVVWLVDGTILSLPEAKISLRSPYFTGDLLVKCMEAPLYDVIIGNVEGARGADKPSYEWDTERNQMPGGGKESSKEREDAVPHAELKRRQKEDDTLEACRTKAGQVQSTKDGSKISFYFSKGVLCRRYEQKGGKSFKQVVVPKTLRTYVLEIAHDSVLAGHQGIKRTTDRVLEAFYWPGIQADVKRFVKSCDACQRAAPKGRLKKAPLGRIPIIDTPFERAAIDLIGPLSSTSENGNRYILAKVDFATRYPDAVALPSCDSRTVAEGLLEIFSRVGLPRQILSDRGATFTSGLMQELTQLLSIQKLHTTPYHPMCNGLVERYNGTLRQMLSKMCLEKPRSWDRYLAPLLFAYREVPQASLGFSPFDLIYGRHVRGPLTLLKEIWTRDELGTNLKTTYHYVFDLRSRLGRTLELAHQSLSSARKDQKKLYDRRTARRALKVGDRVLLLVRTKKNTLLMHWKGPFIVVGKRNKVDYEVDLGHTTRTYHINILKRYEERETTSQTKEQVSSIRAVEDTSADQQLPCLDLRSKQGVSEVALADDLSQKQRSDVMDILAKYSKIFTDVPGQTDILECKLQLTAQEPVHAPQYPIPFAMERVIEEEKALPLVELTKKKEPNNVRWTSKQELAFQELKRELSKGPILKAPDLTKTFILRTDASDSCLGAMLM